MRTYSAPTVDQAFRQICHDFDGRNWDNLIYPEFRLRKTTDHTSPDKDKQMLETSAIITVKNPRDRLVYSKSIDIFNYVGLWLYMLRGSDKLADIQFYNDVARKFIDEERSTDTLRANWGERLFASNSIPGIIHLLIDNKETRRAYAPVFLPQDIGTHSRNLPCLAGMQFLVVNGKLNVYTTMRAQSAIGVLPYDLFLLTMLQEYVSVKTGIPMGEYTHFCPALGVRDFEMQTVSEVYNSRSDEEQPMSPMEELLAGHKALLLDNERWIKKGSSIPSDVLPEYWKSILWVTSARKKFKDGDPDWLPSLYRAEHAFPFSFLDRCEPRIWKQFNKEHPLLERVMIADTTRS